MDRQQILNAAPLLEGKFKSRRDELKENLVKLALSEFEREDEITAQDVSDYCSSNLQISINAGVAEGFLHEFEEVVESGEHSYKIIEDISFNSVDAEMDNLWEEFVNVLELFTKVDPYYESQMRPAFEGFFYEFLGDISQSVEDLDRDQRDTIYTDYGRTEELAEEVADKHRIQDQGIFKRAIKEYLNNPRERLLEFTKSCYTTAVNVDILSREEEFVEFPDMPKKNRKLILDTNVLVALLATTDRQHKVADIICERSSELEFGLYYTEETADELDRLISGCKTEMSGIYTGNRQLSVANNQFVKDFGKKTDVGWDEYISRLEDWRDIVEERGIQEIQANAINDQIRDRTRDLLLESYGYDVNDRLLTNIDHDSRLLGFSAKEREFTTWDFGPFVISFHEDLTQIGASFAKMDDFRTITGGNTLALQPRSWVNYIMAFTPVELEPGEMNTIAQSVLSVASDFEEEITLDEYVHSFAPKVGLEQSDEDELKKFLVNHPSLSDELKQSVREDEGHKAERISREILEDQGYIETIQAEREFKDRIQQASTRVNELEEEVEELESELNPRTDRFRSEYGSVSDRLEGSGLNLGEGSGTPPDRSAEIGEIKGWLEMMIAEMRTSDLDEENEELLDEMEILLSDAIRIDTPD
ncbi:hypothetical protein MBEHAL_1429 [Halarchaeum acidiphilum MH1-52-1]|uniref:PIN like domain-containing protein n=1 Tax=Halarchaeum acidiphilum MH1-52-1 TaxID=1261545 RepID=U3A4U6_9EURY|nr:hypothetical protein [Halarchaeum acidiphilum]GAD52669.1 hypothetical protein MBEHAL_1429 [Halarchaeum acidiphilum MH1-52-1]